MTRGAKDAGRGRGRGRRASLARVVVAAAVAALVLAPEAGRAQRGRRFGFDQAFGNPNEFYTPPDFHGNHPYDGRFTFARIKYRGYEHFGQEGPGWSHDYPRADSHLMMIMRELTALRPFIHEGDIFGGNIIALDDPTLFKFPVAYLSEPGGWHPNAGEVKGLHDYLMKGGFIMFDDFGGNDWFNTVAVMEQVLPKARILPLEKTHAIFDSFFQIEPDKIAWTRDVAYRGMPQFFAIYEGNDPAKRVIAVFNNNLDIGEAWEYSDEGFMPVSMSNEAYKLGVNFLIYALTH
jgi:Domain of unknown function (DUF4159)